MHSILPLHPNLATLRTLTLALCASVAVAGCGPSGLDSIGYTINSGSGGNGSVASSSSGGSGQSYTVGGATNGLLGAGLVLANNAGDDLTISGDGGFTFSKGLASGADYAVTVQDQPINPSQVCTVMNGAGIVSTANVATVLVSCVTNDYTVGGSVSGLSGSGLVLRTNGGNNVAVAGSGSVTLATLASGSTYTVTVQSQPTNPSQTCTVANGSGTIGNANVTNVAVTCTTTNFIVSGSVSGLSGNGLIVQTNGSNVAVSAAGTYTLATLPSGSPYTVTVQTQPSGPAQYCAVTQGTGTVAAANITNVAINCRTDGRYVFVPDYNANTVTSLSIDIASGNLAVVNAAPSDVNPYAIAVTPNGSFLYTANSGSSDISIYAVTAGTGVLTPAGTASTGAGSVPLAITVDPSGQFVLVPDSAGGTLLVFRINPATGALAQVPGSPFPTPWAANGYPSSLTVDPSDRYVYVTDQFVPAIVAFSFDAATGNLGALGTIAYTAGNNPLWVSIDPSDRFLYVSNQTDGDISGWTIDSATGQLTPMSGSPFAAGFTAGAQPGVIAIDPAGQNLYVSDTSNNQLVAFRIDPITGFLTAASGSPYTTDAGPFGVAIDPSGQFLYVGNSFAGTISLFTVDPRSGILTSVPGSPRNYGITNPSAVAIE